MFELQSRSSHKCRNDAHESLSEGKQIERKMEKMRAMRSQTKVKNCGKNSTSFKIFVHLNVIFVDLAEELVPPEAAEPRDPAHFFRAAHLRKMTRTSSSRKRPRMPEKKGKKFSVRRTQKGLDYGGINFA